MCVPFPCNFLFKNPHLERKNYILLSFSVQQKELEHGQKRSECVQGSVRGPHGGVGPRTDSLQAISSDKDKETIDNSNDDDDHVRTVTFHHFSLLIYVKS